MKKYLLGFGGTIILVVTLWTYTQAIGDEIRVCVKKNGGIHMIGEGFKRADCKRNETFLTWNIQGPKGEKGDKGEQGLIGLQGPEGPKGESGLPAQHGAGNIAFIYNDYLLKTDGTVWIAGANPGNNPPYTLVDGINFSGITNVPIPVSDIISWEYSRLVDKNGYYWFIGLGNLQGGWNNFGPLP